MTTGVQAHSCPTLLGERIRLKAVESMDAADFMSMWQDEDFARAAGIEATRDLEGLAQSLERFALMNTSGLFYKWTIRLSEDDRFIGEVETYPLKPQTSPWIEWGVGYSLARSFWGRGLMHEALSMVLNHLFKNGLAQRVRADVGIQNDRSQRLLQRLGFRHEGLQEAKNLLHGEPVDMQLWAISRQRFLMSQS